MRGVGFWTLQGADFAVVLHDISDALLMGAAGAHALMRGVGGGPGPDAWDADSVTGSV